VDTSPIVPTSIAGIKRLAKVYAKRFAIPHHQALDRAAREAGFSSYAIALRNILRPANNNEVEAPKGVLPEKRFSPWRAKRLRPATIQRPTLWLAAFRRTIPGACRVCDYCPYRNGRFRTSLGASQRRTCRAKIDNLGSDFSARIYGSPTF
jgi:hypothetical protein